MGGRSVRSGGREGGGLAGVAKWSTGPTTILAAAGSGAGNVAAAAAQAIPGLQARLKGSPGPPPAWSSQQELAPGAGSIDAMGQGSADIAADGGAAPANSSARTAAKAMIEDSLMQIALWHVQDTHQTGQSLLDGSQARLREE